MSQYGAILKQGDGGDPRDMKRLDRDHTIFSEDLVGIISCNSNLVRVSVQFRV